MVLHTLVPNMYPWYTGVVGGSEREGLETTHRCILRCLIQLGFEAFSVATTLMIASCVGSHFPYDVFFASEGKTTSKKTVFQFLCSFFSLLLSNLLNVFVKGNVQN